MTDAMTRHSDAEVLAAFVDGQLDRQQLEAVTTHLAQCEECRGVIREAAVFEQEEGIQRKPRRAWMVAAAAAVMVGVLGFPFARSYFHRREIDNHQQEINDQRKAIFAAQAEKKQRVLAGRFSGQDIWANHQNFRGPGEGVDLTILMAAYKLSATTDRDSSPAALDAHALAQAVEKDSKEALATLQKIPEKARDAATWNDIAAVMLSTNDQQGALWAVDRALRSHPNMPEALFNRAVILTQMGRADAADAWKRYVAVDSRSQWADEARTNIERLQ